MNRLHVLGQSVLSILFWIIMWLQWLTKFGKACFALSAASMSDQANIIWISENTPNTCHAKQQRR